MLIQCVHVCIHVHVLYSSQAQCQGEEEEEEGVLPGEDMAAEYDTVLVEVAGSILGPLAAVAGGDRFLNLFEQVLTKLLAKLVGPLNAVHVLMITVPLRKMEHRSTPHFGLNFLLKFNVACTTHGPFFVKIQITIICRSDDFLVSLGTRLATYALKLLYLFLGNSSL